jgi:hypothetical protein
MPVRKRSFLKSLLVAAGLGAGMLMLPAHADVVHTPVTDDMLLNAAREPSNWLMAGRD